MEVTNELKKELALIIIELIKQEFKIKHLSMNLVNTLKVYRTESDSWVVEIPAEMYDISKFKKDGSIIYTKKGSYASKVNDTGGFSGTHNNYIDRCINKALQIWMSKNGIIGRVDNNG